MNLSYRLRHALLLLLAAAITGECWGVADDSRLINDLRKRILKGLSAAKDNSALVTEAYKSLFQHVGSNGVKKLIDDEDVSISLQAAWETNKKVVKREQSIPGLTDLIFDERSIEDFLEVLQKRLKNEPPAWWRARILQGYTSPGNKDDFFVGQHHTFLFEIPESGLPEIPKIEMNKDDAIITSEKNLSEYQRQLRMEEYLFRIEVPRQLFYWKQINHFWQEQKTVGIRLTLSVLTRKQAKPFGNLQFGQHDEAFLLVDLDIML